MKRTTFGIWVAASGIVVSLALVSALAVAHSAEKKPTTATYITKEQIAKISGTEQSLAVEDENTKVVDLGYENFTVGVIHRASTRKPPAVPQAQSSAPPAKKCGRLMATLPPGGTPDGITHDSQTEGYYIVSGGGTVFTDGYIANGEFDAMDGPGGPNGPTCGGMAYGIRKVVVKPGDVVIVPPGVVHGWADIPDHVE
jgi:oxalate decarboxylase/phosphoglucose isomerase-like protein (cupin superfamily)